MPEGLTHSEEAVQAPVKEALTGKKPERMVVRLEGKQPGPDVEAVTQPEAAVVQPEKTTVGTKITLEVAIKILIDNQINLEDVPVQHRDTVLKRIAGLVVHRSPYLSTDLAAVFRNGLGYAEGQAEQTADAVAQTVEQAEMGDVHTEGELVLLVKTEVLDEVNTILNDEKLTEYQVLQKLEEFRQDLERRLDLKDLSKTNRTLSNRYRGIINYHLNRKINTILRAVEQGNLAPASNDVAEPAATPAEGEKPSFDWSAFDNAKTDETLLEAPEGAAPQVPVDIEPGSSLDPDAAAAGDPIEAADEEGENATAATATEQTPDPLTAPPAAPPTGETPAAPLTPEPPKTPENGAELSQAVRQQLRLLLHSQEFGSVFKNIGVGSSAPEIDAFINTYFAEDLANVTKETAAEVRVKVLGRLIQGGQIRREDTKSSVFFAQLNECMDRIFGVDSGKHDVLLIDGNSFKRINEGDPGFAEAMDTVPQFKTKLGRLFGRARAFFSGRWLPEKYHTSWEESVAAGAFKNVPSKEKEEAITPEQRKNRWRRKVAPWLVAAVLALGVGGAYAASRYSSENGSNTQNTADILPDTDEHSEGAADTATTSVETSDAVLTPLERLNEFCADRMETFAAQGEPDKTSFYKAGADSYVLEVIENGNGSVCREIPKKMVEDVVGAENMEKILAFMPPENRSYTPVNPGVLREANSASADLVSRIYDQIKFGDVTRARLVTPEEAASMEPIVKEEDGTFTLKFTDGSSGKMLTYQVFGVTAEQLEGLVDFDGIPNARASSETKVEVSVAEANSNDSLEKPEKLTTTDWGELTKDVPDLNRSGKSEIWEVLYWYGLQSSSFKVVENSPAALSVDSDGAVRVINAYATPDAEVHQLRDMDSALRGSDILPLTQIIDPVKDIVNGWNEKIHPGINLDSISDDTKVVFIPETLRDDSELEKLGEQYPNAIVLPGPQRTEKLFEVVTDALQWVEVQAELEPVMSSIRVDYNANPDFGGTGNALGRAEIAVHETNRVLLDRTAVAKQKAEQQASQPQVDMPSETSSKSSDVVTAPIAAKTKAEEVTPTATPESTATATPQPTATVESTATPRPTTTPTPTPDRPAESQAAPSTPESVAGNVLLDAIAEQRGPEAAAIVKKISENEGWDVANAALALTEHAPEALQQMESGSPVAKWLNAQFDSTDKKEGPLRPLREILKEAGANAQIENQDEDDIREAIMAEAEKYATLSESQLAGVIDASIGAAGRKISTENQGFSRDHLSDLYRDGAYSEMVQTALDMSQEDGRHAWLGFESQAQFVDWIYNTLGPAAEKNDTDAVATALAQTSLNVAKTK